MPRRIEWTYLSRGGATEVDSPSIMAARRGVRRYAGPLRSVEHELRSPTSMVSHKRAS